MNVICCQRYFCHGRVLNNLTIGTEINATNISFGFDKAIFYLIEKSKDTNSKEDPVTVAENINECFIPIETQIKIIDKIQYIVCPRYAVYRFTFIDTPFFNLLTAYQIEPLKIYIDNKLFEINFTGIDCAEQVIKLLNDIDDDNIKRRDKKFLKKLITDDMGDKPCKWPSKPLPDYEKKIPKLPEIYKFDNLEKLIYYLQDKIMEYKRRLEECSNDDMQECLIKEFVVFAKVYRNTKKVIRELKYRYEECVKHNKRTHKKMQKLISHTTNFIKENIDKDFKYSRPV